MILRPKGSGIGGQSAVLRVSGSSSGVGLISVWHLPNVLGVGTFLYLREQFRKVRRDVVLEA